MTHNVHSEWCNTAHNQGHKFLDFCCNATCSLYQCPHSAAKVKRKSVRRNWLLSAFPSGNRYALYRYYWVPVLLCTALIQAVSSECILCFDVQNVFVRTVILGCYLLHTHTHTHTHTRTLATCVSCECDRQVAVTFICAMLTVVCPSLIV